MSFAFSTDVRVGDAPESTLDEAAVARVLSGDREAYALLIHRYQEGLFRFALGMTGSSDVAADLVQDSLVKAFTHLDRCREPARFGAWIHRIVRNRCLDYLKAPGRSDLPITEAGNYLATEPAADEFVERAELRTALFAALATLPHAQREAFLLKHLEDRPYEEMSEMLGASISALKMRVKRAREALQTALVSVAQM
jgi:RNA polymerase sigma-70 factor, ECF subfamily